MIDDPSSDCIEQQQRLRDAYRRAVLGALIVPMTPAQQQQFCRAMVEQAHNECVRVIALMNTLHDSCAAQAVAAARAWLDHEPPPADHIQRRFDDFYHPFWLSYTSTSTDDYDCGTAAAYC